jgi:hypothetical protein
MDRGNGRPVVCPDELEATEMESPEVEIRLPIDSRRFKHYRKTGAF